MHVLTLLYHEETEVDPSWIIFDMKCGLNEDTLLICIWDDVVIWYKFIQLEIMSM